MEYQQPILDIYGDKYRVDYRFDVLRLEGDPFKTIPFAEMERATGDGYHRMRYDTLNKQRYVIPEEIDQLPAHIIYTEIPSRPRLDPVEASRFLGLKDEEIYTPFFKNNSIEKTARILPRVRLAGDDFFIDTRQGALIDALRVINKIPIPTFREQDLGIISLRYVPEIRNIETPGDPRPEGTRVVPVTLPPLREIDPEGWKVMLETNREENNLATIERKILHSSNRQSEAKRYDQWRRKRGLS